MKRHEAALKAIDKELWILGTQIREDGHAMGQRQKDEMREKLESLEITKRHLIVDGAGK